MAQNVGKTTELMRKDYNNAEQQLKDRGMIDLDQDISGGLCYLVDYLNRTEYHREMSKLARERDSLLRKAKRL